MKSKIFLSAVCLSTMAILSSCETEEPATEKLTYDRDIKSVFVANCTPCHMQGGANPNKWDDYTTAKSKIALILDRVQREPGSPGFMARNSKVKIEQVSLDKLKKWVDDGLLEY